MTPFGREEFEASYEPCADPVELARRTVVRSFMGFGYTAVALRRKTGFRAISERNGKHPARAFAGMPDALRAITERMRGVVIENRPALSVMERCDGPNTLIFADPPYVHATRSQKRIHGQLEHAYTHEMSNEDHRELLAFLAGARSMVMLSGYATDLYDDMLKGWRRIDVDALADGARARVESLWLNPAAVAANRGLFE